jgi:predicted GTPase
MTSEKKSFLLGQLQEAIDEAVSESGRVGEIVEEMKRSGYDLCLMLESTVTISPLEAGNMDAEGMHAEGKTDAEPESRVASTVSASNGEITLTAEDLEFLQELNIAA